MATTSPKRVWTEEELQSLPENGFIHEVVDGELISNPKNNFEHASICARLTAVLYEFSQQKKFGVVCGSNAGYWMRNRNCRAPDISFIPRARLEEMGFNPRSRTFFPGAPDLAVEVLSPNNTRVEMHARLKDFFASGTRLVWIIDPDDRHVEVCHSLERRKLIGEGGFLDGEDLLPGFRFPIADLFKDWDWE